MKRSGSPLSHVFDHAQTAVTFWGVKGGSPWHIIHAKAGSTVPAAPVFEGTIPHNLCQVVRKSQRVRPQRRSSPACSRPLPPFHLLPFCALRLGCLPLRSLRRSPGCRWAQQRRQEILPPLLRSQQVPRLPRQRSSPRWMFPAAFRCPPSRARPGGWGCAELAGVPEICDLRATNKTVNVFAVWKGGDLDDQVKFSPSERGVTFQAVTTSGNGREGTELALARSAAPGFSLGAGKEKSRAEHRAMSAVFSEVPPPPGSLCRETRLFQRSVGGRSQGGEPMECPWWPRRLGNHARSAAFLSLFFTRHPPLQPSRLYLIIAFRISSKPASSLNPTLPTP